MMNKSFSKVVLQEKGALCANGYFVKHKAGFAVALFLLLLLLLFALSGCTSDPSKEIVGEWYNSKGKCLDIYSDGSWKLEDSYGTGTWKLRDDKITFEFTDFYGDTQKSEIKKDEQGRYIDFGYYGNFYKDSYPSQDEMAEINSQNATCIDPFDGVTYETSGISPYCKVAVNNQKCAAEVQQYVTYKLDKNRYANGETAVITAELSTNTGSGSYILSKSEAEYKIENQAEYITDPSSIDESQLKKELSDKMNASISASTGTDRLFGEDVFFNYCEKTEAWKSYQGQIYFTKERKIENITPQMHSAYLSFLKTQKENQFSDETPYNTCSFVYCLDFSVAVNVDLRSSGDTVLKIPCKMYVNLVAKNIVKSQDGSIYWNNELCDFDVITSSDRVDNFISNTIMSNSDTYNISKVDLNVKGQYEA